MTTPTISKYLATIGARGGKATSVAKTMSSRENGTRGGRPKGKAKAAKRKRSNTKMNGASQESEHHEQT